MKVSLDVLRRIYNIFQAGGETGVSGEDDYLDPDKNLHFIDAYEMPLWHWSTERAAFER
jgi:DNA polymerase epsilon subunit 2